MIWKAISFNAKKDYCKRMKFYNKLRIEIIDAEDVVTGSPETGFIPFGNTEESISFKILKPANEDLYEDIS